MRRVQRKEQEIKEAKEVIEERSVLKVGEAQKQLMDKEEYKQMVARNAEKEMIREENYKNVTLRDFSSLNDLV
jgi:hypothetical protein